MPERDLSCCHWTFPGRRMARVLTETALRAADLPAWNQILADYHRAGPTNEVVSDNSVSFRQYRITAGRRRHVGSWQTGAQAVPGERRVTQVSPSQSVWCSGLVSGSRQGLRSGRCSHADSRHNTTGRRHTIRRLTLWETSLSPSLQNWSSATLPRVPATRQTHWFPRLGRHMAAPTRARPCVAA